MARKDYITKENYNLIKDGFHACFYGTPYQVRKEYTVYTAGIKSGLRARCTQNCPTALRLVTPKE